MVVCVLDTLNTHWFYKQKKHKIFGKGNINMKTIKKAINGFISVITSAI